MQSHLLCFRISRTSMFVLLAGFFCWGSVSVSAQEEAMEPTLEERIMSLPMWDVHNHLTKEHIKAQNFWDIGHYFWFIRELKSVGYPDGKVELSEEERKVAFLQAFELSKNTAWAQLIRQSLIDLYGIDLQTPEDIDAINEKILVTRDDPTWSHKVCDMIGMKTLSIPARAKGRQNGLQEIEERLHYYGHVQLFQRGDFGAIRDARNVKKAADEHLALKFAELDEHFNNDVRVFRYNPGVSDNGKGGRLTDSFELDRKERDEWRIRQYIGHKVLEYMEANGAHIQLFFGVQDMMPDHQTNRLLNMRKLFTMYPGLTFEFLSADHHNVMDLVQAARSYPNVYPSGMWWLTYRPSILHESMRVRLEALPAAKSSLVSTDARHIEWVYIKSLMIKRVLVDFMEDQVENGWLTEEEAVDAARWWLYDSTEALYLQKPLESYLK